jgi:hypothetical protein
MTDGVSIQDLVFSIRRLAMRAYPDVARDAKALDSFVHRRFVEAMRDVDLRNQVRFFRRDSVEQTFVEAYRLQGALFQQKEDNKKQQMSVSAINRPSVAAAQQPWRPYGGYPNNNRLDNRTCYRCQVVGHIARYCTVPENQLPAPKPVPQLKE